MEKILNWEEIFKKSNNFKENSPTKWAYIENFLEEELYNELYKSYPEFNESWKSEDSMINLHIESTGVKLMKIKISHKNKIIIIMKHGTNF